MAKRSLRKFLLAGSEFDGVDEHGAAQEVLTRAWFVAYGPLGKLIAQNADWATNCLLRR
jgi:hypothetical protein